MLNTNSDSKEHLVAAQKYQAERRPIRLMKKGGMVSEDKLMKASKNKQSKESKLLTTITSIMEAEPRSITLATKNAKLFELKAIKKKYSISNAHEPPVVVNQRKTMSQAALSQSYLRPSSQAPDGVHNL